MGEATLFVCVTCKAGEMPVEGSDRPGRILYDRLSDMELPEGVTLVPVECLSACTQGCSVALTKPGAWGYVYGRLAEGDAGAILAGAAAYAGAPDGLVPWRERPEVFRKQSLARIPPIDFRLPLEEPEPTS
jgi:predicted metal-binding protein